MSFTYLLGRPSVALSPFIADLVKPSDWRRDVPRPASSMGDSCPIGTTIAEQCRDGCFVVVVRSLRRNSKNAPWMTILVGFKILRQEWQLRPEPCRRVGRNPLIAACDEVPGGNNYHSRRSAAAGGLMAHLKQFDVADIGRRVVPDVLLRRLLIQSRRRPIW